MSLTGRLEEALGREPGVRLAVLFGSAAQTGQAGRDVDIGLLSSVRDPKEMARIEVALGRAASAAVDLVDLTSAPPLLRFEIARSGKVLLERTPYLWADFKHRAMLDWWDWAPWARQIHTAAIERLHARP